MYKNHEEILLAVRATALCFILLLSSCESNSVSPVLQQTPNLGSQFIFLKTSVQLYPVDTSYQELSLYTLIDTNAWIYNRFPVRSYTVQDDNGIGYVYTAFDSVEDFGVYGNDFPTIGQNWVTIPTTTHNALLSRFNLQSSPSNLITHMYASYLGSERIDLQGAGTFTTQKCLYVMADSAFVVSPTSTRPTAVSYDSLYIWYSPSLQMYAKVEYSHIAFDSSGIYEHGYDTTTLASYLSK